MNDGRKIPRELENPLDNVIIDFCTFLNPHLKKMGFTPNILTTISLLTGIVAAWFVYNSLFSLAAGFILISYVFDCLDGNMARMFDMVTSFGDWYDHVSDISKYGILYLVVLTNPRLSFGFKAAFALVTLTLMILMYVHFGCQELSYQKNKTDSLSTLEALCPEKSLIRYSKYVGCGTWISSLILFLLFAGP